jgi:hypothetical protein
MNLFRHVDVAKEKRKQLVTLASDMPEQIAAKAALYAEAEEAVTKLNAAADVLLSVELKGLKAKAYEQERGLAADHMMAYWAMGLDKLKEYATKRMAGHHCLHWPLVFPEVFEQGGFDAFVGNPPFIGGQKITGILGTAYRDYLVTILADGRKGSADLCAYFFLRVGQYLRENGMAGLLATNTIAQGDTREVGLDQLAFKGFSFPRANPSHPWPGMANLEIAHVWMRRGNWKGQYVLNDHLATGITSFLTAPGLVQGKPYRLAANSNKSFQGSIVLGMGFVLTPEEAQALLAKDNRNSDCLFPYLNGEDVNSRPDQSPSRWVINFLNWPLNRTAAGIWKTANEDDRKTWLRQGVVPKDYPDPVATDYPDLLIIVEERVKPERTQNNDAGARQFWWRFLRTRGELYTTISRMERVMAIPETTKYCTFSWYSTNIIFSHMTKVVADNSSANNCILSSTIHESWGREYSSTLETRLKYITTDAYETFPFPASFDGLANIGERYYQHRQFIMQTRQEGLTTTYNRFHNPQEQSPDIVQLRTLHVEMDQTVAAAYGWNDLDLGHGFHENRQGMRFTISEAARREVLDRLLALNHQRYAEEVNAGIHDKKAAKSSVTHGKRGRKKKDAHCQIPIF